MSIYKSNALLYPNTVTRELADLRTSTWYDFVKEIESLDDTHEDALAFQLTMIDLCGCLRCQPGSYRLSLGCKTCASRTVSNYAGSDASLLRRFKKAKSKIGEFLTDGIREKR